MHQKGVEIRPLVEMTGHAMFNEVFLEEATTPDSTLIGGLNNGWAVANTTLMNERAGLGSGGGHAAASAATPGTVVKDLEKRVGDFVQGGEKVSGRRRGAAAAAACSAARTSLLVDLAKGNGKIDDPSVRQDLMRLYTLNELGRMNNLRAKAAKAIGQDVPGLPNISKLSMSEIVRKQRDIGLGILGPYGTLHAYKAEDQGPLAEATGNPFAAMVTGMALFAQGPPIYGGTDQIQQNIIGERVLGLPKEANNDKTGRVQGPPEERLVRRGRGRQRWSLVVLGRGLLERRRRRVGRHQPVVDDHDRRAPAGSEGCGAARPRGRRAAARAARRSSRPGARGSYMVYVPDTYDPDVPAPLAYVFHGAGSNKEQQLVYSGYGPYADEDGALLVLPDALGTPKRWSPLGPAFAGVEGVNDLEFFDDLSAAVAASYCVDPERVLVTRDVERRVHAGVGGVHPVRPGHRGRPGDGDGVGRADLRRCGAGAVRVLPRHRRPGRALRRRRPDSPGPVLETSQAWADQNGCAGEPVDERIGEEVVHRTWEGCDATHGPLHGRGRRPHLAGRDRRRPRPHHRRHRRHRDHLGDLQGRLAGELSERRAAAGTLRGSIRGRGSGDHGSRAPRADLRE